MIAQAKMSRIANVLCKENIHLAYAGDDIALWGAPSECMNLVNESYHKRIIKLFTDEGVKGWEFDKAFIASTSAKTFSKMFWQIPDKVYDCEQCMKLQRFRRTFPSSMLCQVCGNKSNQAINWK